MCSSHESVLPPAPLPSEPRKILSEDEVFSMYPKLAARLTNLRTILQEPELIQKKEAQDWVEDVKSVAADFQQLTELTRALVQARMG